MKPIFSGDGLENRQNKWRHKKERILGKLSAQDVALLKKHALHLSGERNQILHLGKDAVPKVYILDQGIVSVGIGMQEPEGISYSPMMLLGPADVFGSLFKPDPVINSVQFLGNTRLIAIEAEIFREVLFRYAEFMLRMIEIQEMRRQHLEARLQGMLLYDAYARTAALLLDIREKFGLATQGETPQDIALDEEKLAALAGISLKDFRNVIYRMKRAGLLQENSSEAYLQNEAALRNIALHGIRGFHFIR